MPRPNKTKSSAYNKGNKLSTGWTEKRKRIKDQEATIKKRKVEESESESSSNESPRPSNVKKPQDNSRNTTPLNLPPGTSKTVSLSIPEPANLQKSQDNSKGATPKAPSPSPAAPRPQEASKAPIPSPAAPRPQKASKTQVRAFAKIQSIFSQKVEKVPTITREVEEAKELLKCKYPSIKAEYDELVEAELTEKLNAWISAPYKPNYHKEGLDSQVQEIQKPKLTFHKHRAGYPLTGVHWINPERDAQGMPHQRMKVDCARIEIGDVTPRLDFFASVEQSIVSKDQLRLTHMPFTEEATKDNVLYNKYIKIYDDGIHGCADNWAYINNWLLYKLFRICLPLHSSTPDAFYYAAYLLWPNKMSQRQLSQVFPDWCALYSEQGFDSARLEPWKPEARLEVAQNIQNPECYACLDYTCNVHGFRAQIAPEFHGGDFCAAQLPLPNSVNSTSQKCSKNCWKSIDMRECDEVLGLTENEQSQQQVEVYLDKRRIGTLPIENGGMIASVFILNYYADFCEFAENAVDPDAEDNKEMHTCAGAYRLIMSLAENLTARRYALGIPPPRLPKQELVHNFRNNQRQQENSKTKKRKEELRMKAEKEGLNYEDLLAKDKNDQAKNQEKVRLTAVTPLTACRHDGPCATTKEYCACRENGVCSFRCKCDVNCPQRFPGCNCSSGQCQSKACQCFRANWECNPITCTQCKCDSVDGNESKCKNFGMTRMAQKRMRVCPSAIAGNGLFLCDPVEKDEFITEYVGERITDEEAERRGAIYDTLNCSYIFNLQTGGAIDSFAVGNISRYANHSKDNPTMYTRNVVVAGEHRIGFYAKKDLRPGDELLFNYNYEKEHQKAIGNQTDEKKSKGGRRPKATTSATVDPSG